MGNYAVVKDGIVENILVCDDPTEWPLGNTELVEATSDARSGGTYDGTFHYVDPTPPEPTAEEVARQARLDSVKSKLETLGLTTEEVKEAFGI